METATIKRLTCAETAKLVRVQLAKYFPGTKFSVHSKTYAGGASISIGWNMGPTVKDVDHIVNGFEGASFDGMNDLQSKQDGWLLPDGTAQLAYRPDSWGGSIPGYVSDAPHPNARLVSFGADYIHTNRSYGLNWRDEQAFRDHVALDMCKLQGVAYLGENTTGLYGSGDREQVSQHAWRLLNITSFQPGETYKGVRYATDTELDVDSQSPIRIIKS